MRPAFVMTATCLLFSAMLCACATDEAGGRRQRMTGLSADAQKVVEEAQANGSSEGEKVSLDATITRYQSRSVKLVDDDTKETKIICKYMKATGTRFGQKVCATPEEWEEMRENGKKSAQNIQRTMTNQVCPSC